MTVPYYCLILIRGRVKIQGRYTACDKQLSLVFTIHHISLDLDLTS